MKWIHKYLSSDLALTLQAAVDTIPKDKAYRSWIGLNFKGDELYGVKLYYTWYRELSSDEISRLFVMGDAAAYFTEVEKVALPAVLAEKEAGSGFSFSLKCDHRLNPSFGFYMKQGFQETDPFFKLPETHTFLKQGGNLSTLDFVKNHAVFFDSQSHRTEKDYYYIKDEAYKLILSSLFKDPYFVEAPVIEYAIGEGHRESSADILSQRKAILFGNFQNLTSHYLDKWADLSPFYESVLKLGHQIYCPGIYGDHKYRSLYIFDFQQTESLIEFLYRQR